ncbi:MAG: type II secretion system protein [Verrucomicrobia bacterium]|jgi:type IV pilus assembly protein PilA|nr:type II secretion system protein [Verrucomicrobiota bacterium]MBT7069050.1 type II secretion system protein [Verrucomicrobiota bacterium]MBT7702215.1 type II secretion system protein [Verrucomicrobiota bacterium]
MKRKREGFTLVELMVVAVIVAILAAVAIPLMSANKTRAMATEAEAGCGTIRTALRAMFAETSNYTVGLNGSLGTAYAATALPGIGAGDLDGRYFDDGCYSVAAGATTYTITCSGAASGATQAADVSGVTVSLDDDGAMLKTIL